MDGLSYELLGPVRIWRGSEELDAGPPQQRALLALLLLNEGRSVSVDDLADAMWGEEVPRAARGTLRTYVHRLRRVLGGDQHSVIELANDGYALRAEPTAVDLGRFRQLVAEARTARKEGDGTAAVDRMWTALELWRGVPLAGARGWFVHARRSQLNQLRISTLEEVLELKLELGRHVEVIDELLVAIADEPFRERLRELLMLALYRSGRTKEALQTYTDAARLLGEELGVDPGAGLRTLHERILRADPDLTPSTASSASTVVPAQLPADLRVFVGRRDELAAGLALVPGGDQPPRDVVTAVVSGTAGVGKTTFAVHWAHRVAHRFPDGQLYLNLNGFDDAGAALDPAQALRLMLESLGVPPNRVPGELDSMSALYRSMTSGHNYLILLDNARDSDQVRPLLPGASGSLVIITSRNRLPGLVASAGAHPLMLSLLSTEESIEFLGRRIGEPKVNAEPEAAREISELCARLPQALAVVSARATAHPRFSLSSVAAELSKGRNRLDAITNLETELNVRTVFSWSYQALSAVAARSFRLLSVHPGGGFTAAVAASAAAMPVRLAMSELAAANLLDEYEPGRFAMHDLLRAYAGEVLEEVETPHQQSEAFQRLVEYYVHSADAGFRLHSTYRTLCPLPPHLPGVRPERFTEYEQALKWFTAEYPVLQQVLRSAAAHGLDVHVTQLARAMDHYQARQGRWNDLADAQRTALNSALRTGDRIAIAFACQGLARADALFGRFAEAHRRLDDAYKHLRDESDDVLLASYHCRRASVLNRQGDHRSALQHIERALVLCQESGYSRGEAGALTSLGWLCAQLEDFASAIKHCERAVEMHMELDNPIGLANTYDSLGLIYHRVGDYQSAIENYLRALDLEHSLGDMNDEMETLMRLSETYQAIGWLDQARAALEHALSIMVDLDLPGAGSLRIRLLGLSGSHAHGQ